MPRLLSLPPALLDLLITLGVATYDERPRVTVRRACTARRTPTLCVRCRHAVR